jgi:hypothetical protein
MKMKRYVIFLMLLGLFLSACELESEVTLSEKDTEPKIVISCSISPQDSTVKAYISQARSIYIDQDYSKFVLDFAVVTLTNKSTGETVELPFTRNLEGTIHEPPFTMNNYRYPVSMYSISSESFPILPNVEYEIKVKAMGNTAKASTVVPENNVLIQAFSAERVVEEQFSTPYESYHFNYSWKDTPESSYYFALGGYDVKGFDYFQQQEVVAFEYAKSAIGISSSDVFFEAEEEGSVYTSPIWRTFWNNDEEEIIELYAVLIVCNKDYYDYSIAMHDRFYSYYQKPLNPNLVFGNIEGGIGYFNAFNEKRVPFQLE